MTVPTDESTPGLPEADLATWRARALSQRRLRWALLDAVRECLEAHNEHLRAAHDRLREIVAEHTKAAERVRREVAKGLWTDGGAGDSTNG